MYEDEKERLGTERESFVTNLREKKQKIKFWRL